MKKNLNVGLLGLGTVGQGVVNLINHSKNNSTPFSDSNHSITVHSACVRNLKAKRDCDTSNIHLTTDWKEVVENPEIDIIIEVLGGVDVAFEITKRALELDKPVISANKALLCEKGDILFALAKESKGFILFEAACAGAIPIIRNLRNAIVSERIERLVGILNGTSNFILSTMTETKEEFSKILKQAQDLGYAEADPTFDIEGIDAAHKLVLISKLAFNEQSDEVYYQGISDIKIEDIKYAKSLGFVIKHLAIADLNSSNQLNLRVHPALVHQKELISKVSGAMNTIAFKATFSGEHLFYGAGAGGNETASAILADLSEVVRFFNRDEKPNRTDIQFNHPIAIKKINEISEFESRYYLRLQVLDKAGILAKISQDLNNQGISIDIIHQDKEIILNGDKVKDIVIITHHSHQSAIDLCLEHFKGLESVISEPVMIRVYN